MFQHAIEKNGDKRWYMRVNRSLPIVLALAVLGLLATGCVKKSSEEEKAAAKKASMENIKQEAQDLVSAIGSYGVEQREEAITKLGTAVDDMESRIQTLQQRLEEKSAQMDEQARETAEAELDELREHQKKLATRYEELKSGSADAWEQMKSGFLEAYTAVSEAAAKAEKELKSN
ncbi:hypothetical protein JW992_03235 [candidate division KSB1 bacterium]|nr:hypothetical protein [candidate division KSB1 bacterium]